MEIGYALDSVWLLHGQDWTLLEAEEADEDYEALLKKIPLGRMGTPEDIADAVQYFLQSKYTNGQILSVDGGLSISS